MVSVRFWGRTCCTPDCFAFVHARKENLLQHRDVLRLWYRRSRVRDYRNHSLRKVGVGRLTVPLENLEMFERMGVISPS
jgi:hypothetical protein